MRREVGVEPRRLPRRATRRRVYARAVEDDHVPRTEVVAVVRAVRVGCGRTELCELRAEIVEVARGVGRLVLVVADRRPRPGLEGAPGRVVAIREVGGRTARV